MWQVSTNTDHKYHNDQRGVEEILSIHLDLSDCLVHTAVHDHVVRVIIRIPSTIVNL